MKKSFIIYALFFFGCAQTACAVSPEKKEDAIKKCELCQEALNKASAIEEKIKSQNLKPDFENQKTIALQRKVKFEIADIISGFLKQAPEFSYTEVDTMINIWMIGALFDEHYTIAEDTYPMIRSQIEKFYTRLGQRMTSAKAQEKKKLKAIQEQMKLAQTEYEEGNG